MISKTVFEKRRKILVILGPTASGKSALAVELARKFRGEVVSADSRQVYKGLDIGTGKITKREMRGVPHHMLDILSPALPASPTSPTSPTSPAENFTVEQFKIKALKAIADIHERGKLPIICGGTGFYIQAIVENIEFPEVLPNEKLRAKLEKISTEKLLKKLTVLDPRRAKEVDPKNKRRIIRAIEIASVLGKVPKTKSEPIFEALQIGVKIPRDILRKKIHDRLISRLKKGMVNEAKKLHAGVRGRDGVHSRGLSWKRMEELGLEYRYLARHLIGKISKEEMERELENKIWSYARRQMTWFKRDKRVKWFEPSEKTRMEKEIKKFLRSNQ